MLGVRASDMKFDEDMSDMEMILPQRGSLEGGGPSSHAPGSRQKNIIFLAGELTRLSARIVYKGEFR
jgi:hypothetical protein